MFYGMTLAADLLWYTKSLLPAAPKLSDLTRFCGYFGLILIGSSSHRLGSSYMCC